MEFWFINDKTKSKVQLPVPPGDFNNETGKNINTLNINDFGEYAKPGDTKLSRLPIKSFFPAKKYPFVQTKTLKKPYDLVKIFEAWSESGVPIRLMITETNINMPFYIETFTYGERAGSRDVEFDMLLVEFRDPNKKAATSSNGKKTVARSSSAPLKPKTYTVKNGDTLSEIARKYYGDPNKWKSIASLNGIKDPKKLQVGKVLRLP